MGSRWLRDGGFVAALTLARIGFGFQFQTVASLGPELVARYHLDFAALGTLIGLFMLPGIVVALPGGLLGRRFGARVVVGVGLGLMVGGSVVAAIWPIPALIGTGRVLAGMGAVALIVMQGKMVGDRFPGRGFLPVMALLVGAFPVGAGLVGLTHDWVEGVVGPGGLFVVGAAVPAVALLLFLLTVEDVRQGGAKWALPSRRECALVVVSGLVWTAYNAGYTGFLAYVPSLMAARQHSPGMVAATMTFATWTNLPAIFLGGLLAGRIGNNRVFVIGAVGLVVSVAGPALADWPLAWAVLFGTLGSLHASIIVAIGTLSARPENRAVGMGMFYTTYYLGGTMLPGICGAAADWAGTPGGALLAASALAALALPIYAAHAWLTRRLA